MTGPPPVSFESEAQRRTSKSKAQRRTSGSHTGSSYFISPRSTTGTGTKADPFGVAQLLNTTTTPVSQGPALTILQPGDTLYFLGGTYTVSGSTNAGYWLNQLISPTVSGTASEPITLAAYPGATVNFVVSAGAQPLFGTSLPTLLNYIRFLGFTIQPCSSYSSGTEVATPFALGGTGNEVAYCKIIGAAYPAITDNYQGIFCSVANDSWIHNNEIYGFTAGNRNGAGLKVYKSTYMIVDDNYIHGCCVGIFDKDGGNNHGQPLTTNNTYRRNFLTGNTMDQFLGNNQGGPSTFQIYDNVVDGNISLNCLAIKNEVYNNLLRTSATGDGGVIIGISNNTQAPTNSGYFDSVWNNIVITGGSQVRGYWNPSVAFTAGRSTSPLAYMDYNVYDGAPIYEFGAYVRSNTTYTLSQFRAKGFERHSSVSRGRNIFQNRTTYTLLPRWTTAGRYGDTVGPRYSVAQILNANRYGPGTLGTGSPPVITQEPQIQTVSVGSTATFSIQVNGSGLFYQWQRSNDGGNTWIPLQGANSASYTTASTSSSDNGAIFRALVSCVGGSAWSDTASLAVRTAPSKTNRPAK